MLHIIIFFSPSPFCGA